MQYSTRLQWLRIALIIVGVASLALYPISVLWPAGFVWHHGGQSPYFQMIVGIYATLGVFLLIAARAPEKHLSLIWFAVWSSVVHAVIMAVQAITLPNQTAHLYGDVLILLIAAAVIGYSARSVFRNPDNSATS
jgi:FtsH-binding integral membrane protein